MLTPHSLKIIRSIIIQTLNGNNNKHLKGSPINTKQALILTIDNTNQSKIHQYQET